MKIATAVVGAGMFGRQHARVVASSPSADLVAVVDSDARRAGSVAKEFDCSALTDYRDLIGKVQAVCLAVPTVLHAEIGIPLLENGIDLLVEKPIADVLPAAEGLISAADQHDRVLQVGHLERFNPIVEAAWQAIDLPLFFEVHRMSPFSARSLDVDVVLDLMIHDLDILLGMVDSPIVRLEATGVAILSPKADIGSVRMVFENGCVANLTASRISVERVRKLRFFQPRQYISIDYATQQGATYEVDKSGEIRLLPLEVIKAEPLARQAESFLEAVETRNAPRVSGRDGRRVLEVALKIVEEMDRHSRLVAAKVAAKQK